MLATDVCLGGVFTDDEVRGDLRVRQSACDEPKHFEFPCGEFFERGRRGRE